MDAQRPAPAPAPESNGPKPPWYRRKVLLIWLSIIAVLVVIGVVNNLPSSDTEQPAPTREQAYSRATATPKLLPARTSPPRPTATRQPVIRVPRGIGVSRRELQSFFASPPAPFAFDPPNTMKDGRTRVLGVSPDGLALLELIGPAHNLQQTHMTVDWSGTQAERIPSAAYLLSFAALSAPGDDSNSKTARTDWVTDNVVNAMLSGQASTTHQGLRFTLEFFEELRFLSLTVEPAR